MADQPLLSRWPLPGLDAAATAVLAAWAEPHRRYHDTRHLTECLDAASDLGGGVPELLALWFHDAVHTGTPGHDEAASAAFAHTLLAGSVEAGLVEEVSRLVLLTRAHRPEPGDVAGAVVCDADLWVLGATPSRYRESVRDLRAESGLDLDAWVAQRRRRVADRLAAPIYHTAAGTRREARARANLAAELHGLSR
ncbi:MAG: hypothetical protein QM582_10385 [Micropruina sp.]|uniref:HD domain-containing protein n=1 Tax=Micropruina sp. TaxID=2737536 RepID=UPI0039E43FE4